MVLGVGLEPTGDFSAALQEQCNRRYANPAYLWWTVGGGIEPLKTRNVQGTSVTHHPAQNYYLGGFTSHHVEHSCKLLND